MNLFDEHYISVVALRLSDLDTLCIFQNPSQKILRFLRISSSDDRTLLAANLYQELRSRYQSSLSHQKSQVFLMDKESMPKTLEKLAIQAIRLWVMKYADWVKSLVKKKTFLLSSQDHLPAFSFYREEFWDVPWKRK